MEQTTKHLKEFVGEVISTAMQDTIIVSVPVVTMHPIYKKRFTKYKKCYVHVASSQELCKLGDKVRIVQSTPRSKLKRRAFVEKIG